MQRQKEASTANIKCFSQKYKFKHHLPLKEFCMQLSITFTQQLLSLLNRMPACDN